MISISVCIAVYNRENYIGKCIESILGQSVHSNEVEFIFVDDGSSDSSCEIIESYMPRFSNCKTTFIRLDSNHGLWYVRNLMYKLASGKYILNVDADDMLVPGVIAKLINHINLAETAPDILIFPYYVINDEGRIIKEVHTFTNNPDLNELAINTANFSIWNKLIKTSLIRDNNLHVCENVNCWEDVCVTAPTYSLAKSIEVVDFPGYMYRKHSDVAYTSRNHKKILDEHILCSEYLIKWYEVNGLSRKYCRFLNNLKFAAKIKMLRGNRFELRRWRNCYPECHSEIMHMPGIPWYYKILFKALTLF